MRKLQEIGAKIKEKETMYAEQDIRKASQNSNDRQDFEEEKNQNK